MKTHRKHFFIIKPIIAICIALFALFPVFSGGCNTSQEWAKAIIQQNYYRFDGDYSQIENLQGLNIEQMMERLDIYSQYYTREEYEKALADNAGSKSGVGVSFVYRAGEGIVLYSVVGNSPAYFAGLKAGDVIISAAAEHETRIFTSQEDFSQFITNRDMDEEFSLTLSTGKTVTLAKRSYTASYVCMYLNDKSYHIEYGESMEVKEKGEGIPILPQGTAYMYLSQFYGGAATEMGELIKKFNAEGCTSLILDLRGNGGGYVDLMADMGGLFTAHITGSHAAMKAVYRDGQEQITNCKSYTAGAPNVISPQTHVYIMADDGTASASEALIGVLVSYDVVSYNDIFLTERDGVAKTYGKGIMQSTYRNVMTGEALKLTVAGIFWPKDDITIHGVGLTPQMGCSVAPAGDDIVNVGYDEELLPVVARISALANSV